VRSLDNVGAASLLAEMDLPHILGANRLTHAEYAVLFHVGDTVVTSRADLAHWVARNLPNNVPAGITVDECDEAIASLITRELLVTLTKEAINADLARWHAEERPVSWGVDRRREPDDVDVTAAGFRHCDQWRWPDSLRPARMGYNDEEDGVIRAFGETAEACERQVRNILARVGDSPWRWPAGSVVVEPIRELGTWWYSRYEIVPTGFEAVVRRSEDS
jgi:hypothetical protein